MINVYIVSGFLGSGKTTFIQKLLKEHEFEKVMLLENEFGEASVDGAFFDTSLKVREINNGCICCSLQGDFKEALEEIEDMGVTDLLIEPSGVGKLSEIIDVIKADADFRIVSHICIVDVKTAKKYHNNFKEYFDDQVNAANAIILSHIDVAEKEKVVEVMDLVNEINDDAYISTKPVDEYSIEELLNIIVSGGEILPECDAEDECHHEGHECCHHHHHHDEECECHHHHHHDEECGCHHHHDDDDEVFKNVAFKPTYVFTEDELKNILSNIPEDVIRVKGYVFGKEGTLYFNYVLNEYHVYYGTKRDDALVVVIGTDVHKDILKEAFHG